MGECLITRRGGEAYELPVLDENYPEDVTLTVIKGNTAEASFNAIFATHGKPSEYTYQWYVDGVAVEGANNSLFVMADLGETVNHSVYCEITNKAGTVVTRVATLKVTQYYTPVLNTSYPADADVTYKYNGTTSATFNVQIATDGNPADYSYQWYVNGSAVSGETGPTYTKAGMNADATYTVYCEVTNAAGTVQSRTATLDVSLRKTYLYNNGDSCADVTGGWAVTDRYYNYKRRKPTLTLGASTMKVDLSVSAINNNFENGCVETNKTIDLTDYSILTFVVTAASFSKDYYGTQAYANLGVAPDGSGEFSFTARTETRAAGTFTVDVSKLSGAYVIVINPRQQTGGKSTLNAWAEFSEINLV